MDIASVSSLFTFGIFTFFHLNWRAWSVIHTMSFSYYIFPITPKIYLLYLSFFWGNFAKECTIVGLVYPVWQIKTGMTVEFVIMWSLDLSMLSDWSLGMRSDTISSSSSTSAANSFNFWSKVGFFCVTFFLCALLEFDLASLDVVLAEPSVKPNFFPSCCYWQVLHEFLCSLSLPCYFFLTFYQLRFLSILSTRMLWPFL